MAITPIDKVLYTAKAHTTGGREGGASRTSDGHLDVKITPPGRGEGTNPEQLFAAGYAACFGSAVGHVARMKKLNPGTVTIDASVSIGAIESGGFGLAVELVARLPDLSRADAEALVAAAHQVCPYSNATRGNIVVNVKVA